MDKNNKRRGPCSRCRRLRTARRDATILKTTQVRLAIVKQGPAGLFAASPGLSSGYRQIQTHGGSGAVVGGDALQQAQQRCPGQLHGIRVVEFAFLQWPARVVELAFGVGTDRVRR